MDEAEYQSQLENLRKDWGGVHIDPNILPGYLRSNNDPTTGVLIGMRSRLFAEIINRALDAS